MINTFKCLAVVLQSVLDHNTTTSNHLVMPTTLVLNTTFAEKNSYKLTTGSILHMANYWRRNSCWNVLSDNERQWRLLIPALAKRTIWCHSLALRRVTSRTSHLTKIGDEGVWSSQQNWRVARLELKMAELHCAVGLQRVSLQMSTGFVFFEDYTQNS